MIESFDLDQGLLQLGALDAAAFALAPGSRDKLVAYLELLLKWNGTYNLTAIREPARMVTHHVLDALAVLPHLRDKTAETGRALYERIHTLVRDRIFASPVPKP